MSNIAEIGFHKWLLVTASGEVIGCKSKSQAMFLSRKINENVGVYGIELVALVDT